MLQGLTAATVIVAPLGLADDTTAAAVTAFLCIAAVLCGAGLTSVFERALTPVLGSQSGCVLTAFCTACGMSLVWIDASLLLAAFLIGIGLGSDWSSVSEVARRSLPTKLRWRGIRIWTISFALGAAIAIAAQGNVSLVFGIASVLSASVLVTLLFASPLHVQPATPVMPETPPAEIPQTAEAPIPDTTENTDAAPAGDAEDCDATECCGGGVKEIQPTPFWHGVLLATVGLLSFYLTVCHVCDSRFAMSDKSLLTFAIGLPAGYLLIINTAPKTGYIVALLPCLLFGIVSSVVFQLWSADSAWGSLMTFCCGVFAAAVSCGVSAVVGELFSDCPTDAIRSRVLSVALFAASATMVAFAAVRAISSSDTIISIAWPAVFVVGLLVIRSLPSPVISSLGNDDDSNSDDEELNDVLSALNS